MPQIRGNKDSAKTKASGRRDSDDLAATLESLLKASQRTADQLGELLQRTDRVRSEVEQAEAILKKRLCDSAHRLGELNRRQDRVSDDPLDERPDEAETKARTEELETARSVAEEAARTKGSFLAAMSRELRTPVDALARMMELLRQTNLDKDQERYLRTASESVCALLSLMDSMLTISEINTGLTELRSTDFDLRRIVDDTVELLTPASMKKGVALSCRVGPEVPAILRGEPGRLRQLLLYAIRRAVQLAAHGEVSLDTCVEGSAENTTTIRFTVSHSDTHVSREDLSRLIAPSAHLNGRSAPPEGGRGLGLAVARRIMELMGGRFGVESDDGRGFAIWFSLPLDNYRQPEDDRRAHGRLPQELLKSNLGPVLDLSMGGMRVRCAKAPKGRVQVELEDADGPVRVQAEVMWTRRLGFRKYEVGLYFPHVPPNVAKQLTKVSLNHRLRRLLGMT